MGNKLCISYESIVYVSDCGVCIGLLCATYTTNSTECRVPSVDQTDMKPLKAYFLQLPSRRRFIF